MLIIVAEVVLKLLMWARLFDACLLFRWARLLEHLGMTLAGLVGIPFLYGNTRRGPHPDQQHLMGGIVSGARQAMKNPTFFLAIAMVLGELCGFLTGFYTEEWTWLAVSAVVTILGRRFEPVRKRSFPTYLCRISSLCFFSRASSVCRILLPIDDKLWRTRRGSSRRS